VTLDGDIVRPGGSVSGGSPAKRQDQGVLARERSLRELPGQITAAQQRLAELRQSTEHLEDRLQRQRQELAGCDTRLAEGARLRQAASASLAKLQGQASQVARELAWRQERLAATEKAMVGLDGAMTQDRGGLERLEQQVQSARSAVAAAEAELAALDTAHLVAELMQRRSAADLVAIRVSSQQDMLGSHQRDLGQLEMEIHQKQARVAALAQEHEDLQRGLEEQRAVEAGISAQIEAYQQRIGPAEDELVALEAERSQVAREEVAQRQHSEREENLHYKSQLALQRSQDELAHLRAEIDHDVGLVELEQDELVEDQPPLPLRPLVERLPAMEDLPEGVEQEIRRLRALYSRLGSVNPNAPEEYAAAAERHEFLVAQAADLREAATSLETVIGELDEVMQKEFLTTFRAVAREFREQFTGLFGGGTARLELSEPDIPLQSGIEIIVRPPGKRAQPLPLLSGGERSLTAAALILAILKVSPPPFCILDEVDAALDEANVNRFRSALREVAEQTQFIIITHNRGTIEAADTIYGISMGSDSTSQALSLRLEDRAGQRELVAA
jgi:chromosome segregation protein